MRSGRTATVVVRGELDCVSAPLLADELRTLVLAIAGAGLAVLVVAAIYGSWLRSMLIAIGLMAPTGIEVVGDRAAFRRGGWRKSGADAVGVSP